MTAQTTVSISKSANTSSLLQRALQGNGLFSLLSGLAFIIAANPIATFLGGVSSTVLMAVGVGLLIYAADLFFVARQSPIKPLFAWLFIAGDVVWVLASALLLMTDWVAFTNAGWWAVAIIADIVAVFAILQYVGLRREA
ncbi:MAG: hypothetical protein AAF629_13545 [Chloroflexota bacterium]